MKKWMFYIVCLLAASVPLSAVSVKDDRVLSHSERLALQEKRAKMRLVSDDVRHSAEDGRYEARHWISKEMHARACDIYVFNLYPEAAHLLNWVHSYGEAVEFEDGSSWQIAYNDQYEVMCWYPGDIVYLTQSDDEFSLYYYMVINETRGTVVYANRLTKPSSLFFTKRISYIDHYSDQLVLDDGTYWRVAWIDDTTLHRWMPGDKILLGINSGYDAYLYPFILVNVGIDIYNIGADEYVTAQRIY